MSRGLYWQISGSAARPSLVLLHGWGSDSRIWQSLLPALSRHYCLHLLDLPGYGENIAHQHSTLEVLSEQIYRSAPKPAYWLGWSLGGLIATQVAANHPDQVRGLITVASSPCFMANGDWPGLQPAFLAAFTEKLKQAALPGLKRFIALECLGDKQSKTLQQVLVNLINPAVRLTTLTQGLQLLATTDLRATIASLPVPQQHILGEADKIVPPHIATADTLIFADSGHVPFLSSPEHFIAALTTFTANR